MASSETRGAYLQALIQARSVPRNQLATLSGLTNTYIRDLERDVIANVPRGNLIALGLVLNLGLPQIDVLLARFDRAALATNDVPAVLALADRLHISTALHTCRNMLYELILASLIRPGTERVAIVNQRPTGALRPPGYRTYFDRLVLDRHPFYGTLVEAVGAFRGERLRAALAAGTRVEHVLNLSDLAEYGAGHGTRLEQTWRRRHIAELAALVREEPNFTLRLVSEAPNFQYTLATAADGTEFAAFEGRPSPGTVRASPDALMGFATAAPAVVASFSEDFRRLRLQGKPGLSDPCEILSELGKAQSSLGANGDG